MHHHFIFLPLIFIFLFIKKFIFNTKKNKNNNSINNNKAEDITKLTRQCARWLIAAEQDESPLISILHVQYGMGYLWAIKDITTPIEFYQITGLNWEKFEKGATDIQDKVSKRAVKACPQFIGDLNVYFGRIAGEI